MISQRRLFACASAVLVHSLALVVQAAPEPVMRETTVWKPKEDGVSSYFVYGLTITPSNTVLAFSEARLSGGPPDAEPHHFVLKRSTDLGATWSKNIFLERADGTYWREHGQPGKLECWANPAAITDRRTGRVFIFYVLNEGDLRGINAQRHTRVFYRSSTDDGLTWSDWVEVTDLLNIKADGSPNRDAAGNWQVDRNGFRCDYLGRAFHMPGPGHGLQLKEGRMLMQFWNRTPLAHSETEKVKHHDRKYGLSLLYSDDGGTTWKSGPCFGEKLECTESRMVELDSGEIYLNARTSNSSLAKRGIYLGRNRGLSWSEIGYDEMMPPYQAVDSGLLAVRHNGKQVLLLSRCRQPTARKELTISASLDAGKTWALHKLVHEEGASYSDMIELPDGTIGLLYRVPRAGSPSRGAHSDAAFIRFNLVWLGL